MSTITVDRTILARALNALRDVAFEIEQPEVNELVSGALERRVERSIRDLEDALDGE